LLDPSERKGRGAPAAGPGDDGDDDGPPAPEAPVAEDPSMASAAMEVQ